MAQITISRWGKNLAIRFPGEIVKALGLSEGERLEVESKDGDIFIYRAIPQFSLEEMFRGKAPRSGVRTMLTPTTAGRMLAAN